jgi:hypothetical protein
MLQDAGVLDRRVAQLAGSGELRSAAESFVSLFVKAGQVGRLREIAVTHSEPSVREAVSRLLPKEAATGELR